MPKRSLPSIILACLLAHAASAQTATWIASGSTPQNWVDASNWNTGVVPNSAGATAILNRASLTGPIKASLGSNELYVGKIQFELSPPEIPEEYAQIVIGSGGSLAIQGEGIAVTSSDETPISAGITFNLNTAPASLDFYDHATISTAPNTSFSIRNLSTYDAHIGFHDYADAGKAIISTGLHNGSVTFNHHSTASQATLSSTSILFKDVSTAGSATLNLSTYGTSITFQDQSTAGNATLSIARYGTVTFRDDASAGTATLLFAQEGGGLTVKGNADVSGLTIQQAPTASSSMLHLDLSEAASDVTMKPFLVKGPGNAADSSSFGYISINLGANSLKFNLTSGNTPMYLGGVITGPGGLSFTSYSSGAVNISNPNNSYTGETRIERARVILSGGRISRTSLTSGGQLSGYGTIGGNLLNNHDGAVVPQGTLHVLGNYTQHTILGDALPLLYIDLNGNNRIMIDGSANLGGRLSLTGLGSFKPVGSQTIDFLSASAVVGEFETVFAPSFNTALLRSQLRYTGTGVSYVIEQKPFTSAASTPAQIALAAQIDASLASSTGDYRTLLSQLNALPDTSQVDEALTALAPDRYATLAENGFAAASARQAGFDRRLSLLRAETKTDYNVFFEASYRKADFDATPGLPKANSSMGGGQAGATWSNQGFSGGIALAYESGEVELDQQGSQADVKSLTPSVFAQYVSGPWFINGLAGYSSDDYTLRRRIAYTGVDTIVAASPSGRRTDFSFTAGYTAAPGAWTLIPQAGILASNWKINGFEENGASGAGLDFSGWSNASLRSRLGVETAYHTESNGFTPRFSLMWLHEFEDKREVGPVGFPGAGGRYVAPGREADENLVQASLGLDARLGKATSLYATLGGLWGNTTSVTADFSIGLHWSF